MKAVLAGGGTGGHIRPALAIAEELERRSVETTLVVTERDRSFAPLGDFNAVYIDAPRLERTPVGLLRFWVKGRRAMACLRACIEEADFVVGTGGYGSYPALRVACSLRKSLFLQEQNVLPGRVTRLFSRKARAIFSQWEVAESYLDGCVVSCGAPVHRRVLGAEREEGLRRFGLEDKRTLLVMGGSQGARAINYALLSALDGLGSLTERLQVLHLTGRLDFGAVSEATRDSKVRVVAREFEKDMALVYAVSDFAIARAGATTIAEFSATATPALLVPYPYAADRHQHLNAQWAEKSGGFLWLDQRDFGAEVVVRVCTEVLLNPERLRAMKKATGNLYNPEADKEIVERIFESLGT